MEGSLEEGRGGEGRGGEGYSKQGEMKVKRYLNYEGSALASSP